MKTFLFSDEEASVEATYKNSYLNKVLLKASVHTNPTLSYTSFILLATSDTSQCRFCYYIYIYNYLTLFMNFQKISLKTSPFLVVYENHIKCMKFVWFCSKLP